ncbi:MAG: ABC transporter ATP-binding protein [Bacilli bacterium]|nr:ABC transporter ATP-binding protein [Bacilli bacterium]
MTKVVLHCKNLNFTMNKKKIIDNVSFDLEEKDILGFIGPNGAGKTSIIKLILGLYQNKNSIIKINNYDLNKEHVLAISNVGAIIENPELYTYMSGYQNLKIAADMYKISKERINEIVKLVDLEKSIHLKVSKYSLGMKQRLGIANAILHNPKILILDEPTNGLDPTGILELKKLLKELSNQGMAIIISSHILSELESLCNKFCFIKSGKIIAFKTKIELTKANDNYIFKLSTTNLKKYIKKYIKINNNSVLIKCPENKLNKIIKKLINNKIKIYEIKKESSSLENNFINIIEGDYNV